MASISHATGLATMSLKNAKHELFAQELANGSNASQAYRNAGYSDNRAAASRLQQDERIQQRVAQLLTDRAKRQSKASEKAVEAMGLSKQWVLGRLVENVERGLQARAVLDDDGKPIGEYRYDGGVVNRALELLGKEQGMFIDRKETGAPGDFANMQSADEVLELVRKELGDATADALAAVLTKHEAVEPAPDPAEQPAEIEATHEGSGAVN